MNEDIKPGESSGSCGCGAAGGKCACGGKKCCCGCIKKAIGALVLLLLGGVIGYFMGTHCAYAHCYRQMGSPMANSTAMPVDAPVK